MVVKENTKYKETEIGMIPEDWEVKRLGNIGETIIGLTYSPNDVVDFGKLVLRSSNIQNNKLAYDDNVYVSKTVNDKLILRDNDILICVRNGSRDLIGKSAIIKGKAVGETFGAFMSIFRTEQSPSLIFYLIISDLIQKQINNSLGATINQITNKTLNDFLIPLSANFEEQTTIANTLTDIDQLINSLEKLLIKKRSIKQGAMQELLSGKKRLPEFAKSNKFKQTEIGIIPEDWEIKKLGDMGEFKKGKGIKKDEVVFDGLPCIRYGEIYTVHSEYIKSFCSFISSKISKNSQLIKYGDILFAGSGETAEEIGKCIAFLEHHEAYAGGDIIIFSPHKDDSKYLGFLLNQQCVIRQKAQMAQGDAVVHIYSNNLSKISCTLPSLKEEQTAIAQVLSDMDLEINALETKLTKYQQIKQGMMENLLTGRIRLV